MKKMLSMMLAVMNPLPTLLTDLVLVKESQMARATTATTTQTIKIQK
jgi:hypothetical protein